MANFKCNNTTCDKEKTVPEYSFKIENEVKVYLDKWKKPIVCNSCGAIMVPIPKEQDYSSVGISKIATMTMDQKKAMMKKRSSDHSKKPDIGNSGRSL